MNQKNLKLGKVIARIRRLRILFMQALYSDSPSLKLLLVRRLQHAHRDIRLIRTRSIRVSFMIFNINRYSDENCFRDFRFTKTEIPMISDLIDWSGVTQRNRYKCDPFIATCILLRRLAYPCRWADLELVFGLHASHMSEIFIEAACALYNNCGELVTTFRKDLMDKRAPLYARSIQENGGALNSCVGFIDGTKIKMARPSGPAMHQRAVYSGHKRFHCLTYQTISTPDGLIFHLFGPIEGRRADAYLYHASDIDDILRVNLNIGNIQYYIYGDQAYAIRPWLQVAFPRQNITPEQIAFNTSMNKPRTAVEWSYGELKNTFASQDFHRKLQVKKTPVGVFYIVAVLLRNFKTCLGHGTIAEGYFKCQPPSLQEYTNIETEV